MRHILEDYFPLPAQSLILANMMWYNTWFTMYGAIWAPKDWHRICTIRRH